MDAQTTHAARCVLPDTAARALAVGAVVALTGLTVVEQRFLDALPTPALLVDVDLLAQRGVGWDPPRVWGSARGRLRAARGDGSRETKRRLE